MSELNTKIVIEIEKGTSKKTGKDWEGIRIRIGDFTRVLFPYGKAQMEQVKKVLEANKES